MADTLVLDRLKLVKDGLQKFLKDEQLLKELWIASIGTDREKLCLQEFLVKRNLVTDMIKHLEVKL